VVFNARAKVGLAALLAVLAPGLAPAAPDDRSDGLVGYLYPVPRGYHTPRPGSESKDQRDPIPLTDRQEDLILSPYRPPGGEDMGWVQTDRRYFKTVPPEAREIPRSLAGLPVVRFDNIEIGADREIRWRAHGRYDQWFLRDKTREINAVIAIERETRKTYFFEYKWGRRGMRLDHSLDNCFSCHPNGLRTIRTYRLAKVDVKRLAEFNKKILAYGPADYGNAVDPKRLGPPIRDTRCAPCHDGKVRNPIYEIHASLAGYYLDTLHLMPPQEPLPLAARHKLLYRLYYGWKADRGLLTAKRGDQRRGVQPPEAARRGSPRGASHSEETKSSSARS
jgi:hypothetical protein